MGINKFSDRDRLGKLLSKQTWTEKESEYIVRVCNGPAFLSNIKLVVKKVYIVIELDICTLISQRSDLCTLISQRSVNIVNTSNINITDKNQIKIM